MARREPFSVTPPALYRALKTVANEERRKVPGITTSPITFTWMVRMLRRVMLTVELGLLPPTEAYLDARVRRSFSFASAMVRPAS